MRGGDHDTITVLGPTAVTLIFNEPKSTWLPMVLILVMPIVVIPGLDQKRRLVVDVQLNVTSSWKQASPGGNLTNVTVKCKHN